MIFIFIRNSFYKILWRLRRERTILFAIGSPQDFQTLVPLIREADDRQLSFTIAIIGKSNLTERLPSTAARYKSRMRVISFKKKSAPARFKFLARIAPTVLICGAESSAKPHRYMHKLAQAANVLGIHTYTLQHGLENIGINYIDEEFGSDVKIASGTIFTWKCPAQLPNFISEDIRSRCIGLGRAMQGGARTNALSFLKEERKILSVFENLHWKRYSNEYRRQFYSDFIQTVQSFPDITFLLKPHIASNWTNIHKSQFLHLPNLILIDFNESRWREMSAAEIIDRSMAAIQLLLPLPWILP